MPRVLFRIGGLAIYSYPAMLYVGTVFGIWAELHVGSRLGLAPDRVLTATLCLLAVALFGARLLYVIALWPAYRGRRAAMWRFADGGASMYGGLLLAAPASIPLLTALRLPFGDFWDAAIFAMLIGMIVTRGGCLLNGCCAGRVTQGFFGLSLPNHHGVRARRIPTQVLEAGWGATVLAGAVAFRDQVPFSGALFLYSVGAYAAARVVLEPLREEQDQVLGVPLQRLLSILLVLAAIGGTVFGLLTS